MAFRILTPEQRQAEEAELQQKLKLEREQRSTMLDELLALEDGLTDYEVDFVEDMSRRRDGAGVDNLNTWLTSKQVALLERIHSERCE
jgi:hypothetical protein